MKKNSLTTAVVAGIAGVAGLAGIANAVNVNPDGLGQVLLYPYYTVNGGNQTLISVVNTTNQAKAVKVRFLESLNSAEVLDFNLYLSEFDVWTAAIVQTADGAALLTNDTSCTVPLGVGKDWVGGVPGASSQFVPFEFESNNPDVIGTTGQIRLGGAGGSLVNITAAERMRQGHIEMIEMGVLRNETAATNPTGTGTTGATTFAPSTWATHVTGGSPANCAALSQAWTGPLPASGNRGRWIAAPGRAVDAPSGGLFGGGVIVDVQQGRALSYNADAVDGFFGIGGLVADADGSQADLHFRPGSINPNLTFARTGLNAGGNEVAVANIFASGSVVTAEFDADSVDAVSAALMARYIFNEFNLEAAAQAASEWVVTFPTKRLHTYQQLTYTAATCGRSDANVATRPDVRPFTDRDEFGEPVAQRDLYPFDSFGSCETYTFRRWDREEGPYTVTPTTPEEPPIISPPRPLPPGPAAPVFPQLCWEANVIAFNQTLAADTPTAVLGATPKQGAHGLGIGNFANGWARIEFNSPATANFDNYLVSNDNVAIVGLPVIGFWAADYTNTAVAAGVRANYSQIHKHRAARDGFIITGTPPAAGTQLNATGLSSWTSS
jgi:hypothetical protein